MLGLLTTDLEISVKKFLALMFLFSGSFAWFLSFFGRFDDIFSFFISSQLWLNIANLLLLFSIIFSAIIGSITVKKIERKKSLFWSTIIGVLSSLLLVFFNDPYVAFFSCILSGASFGFGLPLIQALFAESTIPEERCRVSGFIVLSIFIFVLIISLVIGSFRLDSIGMLSVMIGLRLTGLVPFFLDPIEGKIYEPKSWSEILKYKDFGIYLLAYILFNVCSGLVSFIWYGRPMSEQISAINDTALIFRYVGISVIAVVTGFVADKVGRKKPVIVGLVLLGMAYALVGLTLTAETFFLQLLFSGLAWGMLIVIYNVVPGDLAFPGSEERFYTLGIIIPFILYTGINSAGRFLIFIPQLDIFSTFLSILLFISVIPILYAKETLSESRIKMIKFKKHIMEVSKVVKESDKTKNAP